MSKLIVNLCLHFNYKVILTTAEERYEETWNSYLELLNKELGCPVNGSKFRLLFRIFWFVL